MPSFAGSMPASDPLSQPPRSATSTGPTGSELQTVLRRQNALLTPRSATPGTYIDAWSPAIRGNSSTALHERIHQPYNREGQRTGALRFGDTRAIALAGALRTALGAVTGFTNKSLRGLVAGHLGQDYSQNKMTYDLRRLRLHGLIQRLPHSNTYQLTSEGIRDAVFYTTLQNRLLRPLLDADEPPAKIEIRRALATLTSAVNEYVHNARLAPPHKTGHNVTTSRHQVEPLRFRDFARNRWPVRGSQSWSPRSGATS
jgi:hypothetical protein